MRVEIVPGEVNGTLIKSSLISELLQPHNDGCRIRFYYHLMQGEGAHFALRLSVRYFCLKFQLIHVLCNAL